MDVDIQIASTGVDMCKQAEICGQIDHSSRGESGVM
jgi:hypothetical protein